jgi:hypothetical protein
LSGVRKEGGIIGRLLAGYGELELELCDCVIAINDDTDSAIRAMFKDRGEAKRIDSARNFAKAAYDRVGLSSDFLQAAADMHWCRQIRNQYAHCHWYDTPAEGLMFVDLEALAATAGTMGKLMDGRVSIDVSLLREQEAFFSYVQRSFWFVAGEYRLRTGARRDNSFPRVPAVARPLKHR